MRKAAAHSTSKSALLFAALIAVVTPGCSGDSVRVTTESNNSAETSGSSGASVGISAASADGSQSVMVDGSGSGAETTTRLRYQAAEEGVYQFCLASGERSSFGVLRSSENEVLLTLSNECVRAELPAGELELEVTLEGGEALVSAALMSDE